MTGLVSMGLPIANEVVDLGSLLVLAVVVAGVLVRAREGSFRHFDRWHLLAGPSDEAGTKAPAGGQAAKGLFAVLFRDVFAASVLETCGRLKRVSHLALFWGFVLLGVSTTLAFITNPGDAVLPLTDPVKLFGNAGGALVVVGLASMFYVRYRERAPVWKLTRSDLFMLTLLLAVLTGFVTQQAVYSDTGPFWVSGAFWVHMVFVIALLATAPFTKFFHAVSKPVSILHEELDGRLGREPVLPVPFAKPEREAP